jgi:UDP-xylose/UDP-N-acetylglucosamine transporter B4
MLAMALFLSSCLGIFQEETYKLYGKKWREGLFYCVWSPLLLSSELMTSISSVYHTSYPSIRR